jgi:hypothetical protein
MVNLTPTDIFDMRPQVGRATMDVLLPADLTPR